MSPKKEILESVRSASVEQLAVPLQILHARLVHEDQRVPADVDVAASAALPRQVAEELGRVVRLDVRGRLGQLVPRRADDRATPITRPIPAAVQTSAARPAMKVLPAARDSHNDLGPAMTGQQVVQHGCLVGPQR